MNSQLPRRSRALCAGLILSIAAACAGENDRGSKTEGSDAVVAANDGTIELDLGPGTFDLTETTVGLAGLSSYKATLTVTFDGNQDGQREQWSSHFELIRTREPLTRQLTIQRTEPADEGPPLPEFIAETGGVRYQRFANDACTVARADSAPSMLDMLEPVAQLRTVFGASSAGTESINGIDAQQFTFDERALARRGVSDSTGEMWVASDGGFIVSYQLTTTADTEFFGNGTEGTMTWDYQLSQLNEAVSPELPADCPAGLVSAPTFADAANVLSVPGLLQYQTGGALADLKAFYETELPTLGWSAASPSGPPAGVSAEDYQRLLQMLQQMGLDEAADENPNEAALMFEQGNELLTVIITVVDGVTQVKLFLTR